MDIVDIDRAVGTHLPDEWLKSIMKSVFLAKKLAHDHCKVEFQEDTAVNVNSFYCRGKVEDLLRGAAELLPGACISTVTASGWRHTEVSHGPFTMTAHMVNYPCAMVYDAEYRRALAESQPSLINPEAVMPDAKLYGLFVYSSYRGRDKRETTQYGYLPGSIYLAFPEAAMKKYAHKINLFEKYPSVLDDLLPKEWDSEARLTYKWQAKQQKAA